MKWTRRFRETRRGDSQRERVFWPGVVTLSLLLGAALAVVYAYWEDPPYVQRDFVVRVVDKSLTISESYLGSRPVMRLLVEGRDGRRFRLSVSGEFYERARAGMWVSRRRGELKLHLNEPEPIPPGGVDGARVEAR